MYTYSRCIYIYTVDIYIYTHTHTHPYIYNVYPHSLNSLFDFLTIYLLSYSSIKILSNYIYKYFYL